MSRFGRHFVRTREIKEFERRLINLVVERPGALTPEHEALFRYACVLARMHLFRTRLGKDIQIAEQLNPLRQWMLESLPSLIPNTANADIAGLRSLVPALSVRLHTSRTSLLDHHVNHFDASDLDEEIRHKKLVLVLGGGGGSGLMHLGVFSLFRELGYTPELIVGSSMGGIMGALRAVTREYDPIATGLALPREVSYNTLFRPFTGYSRFGFPGAFHMNLLRIAREIFQKLKGNSSMRFDQLPIKLQIVATGIRTGFDLNEDDYTGKSSDTFAPLILRKKLRMFFSAVRQLSSNPRLLTQVVFGKEPGTEAFPIIEAVGFSCSVPGLLHYDIYHDDPETITPLETLFERHKLLRLCDGGVVNNVPSQVAWDSVQQGAIDSRNAYIMAADVFAPISKGANLIWVPIQQVARQNVVTNKPYSDYHKTFIKPPSPLQLIINQYSRLKSIVRASREELAADTPYIKRALSPLPIYGVWRDDQS